MFSSLIPEKHDYLLALRGVAVIGVVLGHCFGVGIYSLGVFISSSQSGVFQLITWPLDELHKILFILTPLLGTNFVILFFVQSGYLMGKVFHDGKYSVSRQGVPAFYKNRYLRLAPLLYFNLLIMAALYQNADLSPVKFLGDIFFVTNFTDRGVNLVTWSLSHEMQYYLIAPFIFYIFSRMKKPSLAWAACLLSIMVVYKITRGGFLAHFQYLYTFLAGYSVNLLFKITAPKLKERTKAFYLLISFFLISAPYNWLFLEGKTGAAEIIVTLTSLLLVYIAECPAQPKSAVKYQTIDYVVRFLVLTGTISYGIYLWHYAINMSRISFLTLVTDKIASIFDLVHFSQKVLLYHTIQVLFVFGISYAIALTTFFCIERAFRPGLYARLKK